MSFFVAFAGSIMHLFFSSSVTFMSYSSLFFNSSNFAFALFKFEGIDSINELMDYKGSLIFVEEGYIRENLEENEFLIDELVGMSVYDTETKKLGFVVGVSNNGANDLLSVKTNSKHICLVPFIEAFIKNVDIESKTIVINNIEGLLE